MSSSTRSVPNRATRPTSLRARSTSMVCSARSFGSSESSAAILASCSAVRPRQRVPAIGRLMTRPFNSWTIGSGDDPTSVTSADARVLRRKYIDGDGFTSRNTRYTSSGSKSPSRSKRCARTTWKMSPARMCSRAASTARWYMSRDIVERNSGSSVEIVGWWRQAGGTAGAAPARRRVRRAGPPRRRTPRRWCRRRRRGRGTRSRSDRDAGGSGRTR